MEKNKDNHLKMTLFHSICFKKSVNIVIPLFTRFVPQGYYNFWLKIKDKTLQIVPQCDIIRGCATILFKSVTMDYFITL